MHLGPGFSDVVHRPAGPIMGYHGFHVYVNTRLRSTLAWAKLLRSNIWLRDGLKHGTRAGSILWPSVKGTCSPTALQLCFLIHLCSGRWRCTVPYCESPPLASKLMWDRTTCVAALGSGWTTLYAGEGRRFVHFIPCVFRTLRRPGQARRLHFLLLLRSTRWLLFVCHGIACLDSKTISLNEKAASFS